MSCVFCPWEWFIFSFQRQIVTDVVRHIVIVGRFLARAMKNAYGRHGPPGNGEQDAKNIQGIEKEIAIHNAWFRSTASCPPAKYPVERHQIVQTD